MSDTVQLKTYSDGTAHYTFRTTLDGTDYQIRLDWNTRVSRWFLSICAADDKLLLSNKLVLANWPMLRHYHHVEGLPAGELVAFTMQDDPAPPGLYELGTDRRCTLTYFPAGKLS